MSKVKSNSTAHKNLITTAETIMQSTFGRRVALELDEVVWEFEGARSTVIRCRVADPPTGVGETVIVKRSTIDAKLMAYEAAVLEFLAQQDGISEHVSKLYGIDPETGILVMEDAGADGTPLLGNILLEEGQDGVAPLMEFITTLAKLHKATIGKESEFREKIRTSRGQRRMDHKSNSLIMHLREFPQLLADMDIPAPDRLTDELTGAIRLLESPGPFKALVHGDATFGNVFIQKRRALLVDLETATYRHILLDGAVPVIRYVWSAWCFRVPDDVRSRLLDTYCQEIAAVCPEAGDDELFGDHLTACCAAWFVGICSLIPDCIAQNKQWGRVTNRQRVILGLDHFSNYLEKSQQLPRLCQAAQALRTKLQSLWKLTIDNVPIYPAFRG